MHDTDKAPQNTELADPAWGSVCLGVWGKPNAWQLIEYTH